MDDKKKEKMDRKDEDMEITSQMKSADKDEPHMDGPNIIDEGETSNRSQDEGKIYDL